MPSLPAASFSRRRSLVAPAGLVLLVASVLLASAGSTGIAFFVLLLLALATVVGVHLQTRSGARRPPPPALLRTVPQVGFGIALVVAAGGLLTVLVALGLSVLAGSVVGDGALTVRAALGALILGPCVSIGYRCGRWWAFSGAAALVPLLLLAVLVYGPRSPGGLAGPAFAIAAIALATAIGSLRRELANAARSRRPRTARPARPPAPTALPKTRVAGSSSRSARASGSRAGPWA
jgi:hypothetical protein